MGKSTESMNEEIPDDAESGSDYSDDYDSPKQPKEHNDAPTPPKAQPKQVIGSKPSFGGKPNMLSGRPKIGGQEKTVP